MGRGEMIIVEHIRVHLSRTPRRPSRGAALAAALVAVLTITALSPVGASAGTLAQPASTAGKSTLGSKVAAITGVSLLPELPTAVKPTFKLPKCIPVIDSFDRTHECWLEEITFIFRRNTTVIGTNQVFFFQYITLVANKPEWSEEDEVVLTIPSGETAPIIAHLSASCGAHCAARAHFNGILKVGLKGYVSYSTSVGKNTKIETATHYRLEYVAPPFIPTNVAKWNSPWDYRCDNGLAKLGVGCVVPRYIPTLDISRKDFGAAAAMIAWAQKNLDGHWGLKDKGQPLRRLKNPKFATSKENRNVICDRQWRPFGPWHAGSVTMKDSCDEYPFAATYESGAMPPGHGVSNGAACAQVKAVQTSSTGNDPARLWNDVVVIGTFSSRDKCVRGHIPLKLNVDLGNKAYLGLINSDRLIDQDAFWVAVTS